MENIAPEITEGEAQIAWAVLRLHQPAFTFAELRELGTRLFENHLEDWTVPFDHLVALNYLHPDGDTFTVTPQGQAFIEKVMSDQFVDVLLRCEKSQAYGHFCELLYGKDLRQFNMLDMGQLAYLLEVLNLTEQDRILDLGCGIGRLAEYISDVTGADITAIDFAQKVVEAARERIAGKAGHLTYRVGNLNNLDFPPASFDTLISIDTLYFAKDLSKTIGQMKDLLRPGGQMGIFYSQIVKPEETTDLLDPDKTRLAEALKANNLDYKTSEFTESEARVWREGREIIEKLRAEFVAEGNEKLYQERVDEIENILKAVNEGRTRRYLYHIKL